MLPKSPFLLFKAASNQFSGTVSKQTIISKVNQIQSGTLTPYFLLRNYAMKSPLYMHYRWEFRYSDLSPILGVYNNCTIIINR